ncbi:MAG: hypothetical protein FJZ90_07375, partial [Chloroflexi bacterium]|nr:hypothetical protein [Chloroflexota bacterium]
LERWSSHRAVSAARAKATRYGHQADLRRLKACAASPRRWAWYPWPEPYRGARKKVFDLRRAAVVHNLHVIARLSAFAMAAGLLDRLSDRPRRFPMSAGMTRSPRSSSTNWMDSMETLLVANRERQHIPLSDHNTTSLTRAKPAAECRASLTRR